MKDKTGNTLTINQIIKKIIVRANAVISEFSLMFLHIVGIIPSHHFRRLVYRAAGMKIGRGSTIHMAAKFFDPVNIQIGKDTIIGEGVVLDGRDKLLIGNHVDIASEVMVYNAEHDIHSDGFEAKTEPVFIEDYVFIGPRAIILPGVRVKKGAVVAAGAVVTKDVEEYAIVGGVPAKVIGKRQAKELNYKLGRAAWFR